MVSPPVGFFLNYSTRCEIPPMEWVWNSLRKQLDTPKQSCHSCDSTQVLTKMLVKKKRQEETEVAGRGEKKRGKEKFRTVGRLEYSEMSWGKENMIKICCVKNNGHSEVISSRNMLLQIHSVSLWFHNYISLMCILLLPYSVSLFFPVFSF